MFGAIGQPNPEGKWVAEIALAHSDSLGRTSGSAPSVGKSWRINFSRVEKKGSLNWVWSPQMIWSPKLGRHAGVVGMHYPDAWGYVHFQDIMGSGTDAWQDPQWPLKSAASELFFAQDYAKEKVGTAISLEALTSKGWLPVGIQSMRPELTISSVETDWSATLEDEFGCQAAINSEHRLDVRCPGSFLLAFERLLLPAPMRPFLGPSLIAFALFGMVLALFFWLQRSAHEKQHLVGKKSGQHQC
mmetsp:Transcript_94884/g.207469  ORF Transcript_94884/g.207469 Transcript_94884/m.207469 type:complete len:244 (-) Transcript_94884:40-771(-)